MTVPHAHVRSFPRGHAATDAMPPRETILLVDDHPSVRKLLGSILKSEGYSVLEAGSGAEALELCRQYQNKIHLLLTDIIMPEMQGHALAEHIISLRPAIQILYMSGYVEPQAFQRLQPQGQDHFLKKPCDMQELSRKVRRLLDDSASSQA
jgi:two-component system cell cycle sensor histidine kinase/response regulator CckA